MLITNGLPWDNKGIKVAVVGDLMLDEYLDGVVERISSEAPIPIHVIQKTSTTAGGAANVARNIKLAGAEVSLIGVCGEDTTAEELKKILTQDNIDVSGLLSDNRPTTRKTRVTANHQQIVRLDREESHPISDALQEKIYNLISTQEWDVLLLSDYGKGCLPKALLQRLIQLAKSRSKPIIVDPRGKDYTIYRGATLVTPNRAEASLATDSGMSVELSAKTIQESCGIDNVLITLGADGMYGLDSSGVSDRLATVARDVFDVSGAGDTVASIMALSIGCGLDLFQSMTIANAAAGRVVEKWGTQPILRSELLDALSFKATKILSKDALKDQLMRQSGRIVFTNGCFDLLHAGHLHSLEQAKQLGDVLVVAVNSDRSVRELKGQQRPIIPCHQRMQLLAGLACVDYVVEFDEATPESLIAYIEPDTLVKGADYALDQIVGRELVEHVVRIDSKESVSTSGIIDKILQQK